MGLTAHISNVYKCVFLINLTAMLVGRRNQEGLACSRQGRNLKSYQQIISITYLHKALKVKNVNVEYFECFVISGDKPSAKAGMHYSKNNVNFIVDSYRLFEELRD